MPCVKCHAPIASDAPVCHWCGNQVDQAEGIWPPPPAGHSGPLKDAIPPEAGEFVYLGKRMLVLSVLCAPVVFIPLAIYCGIKASKITPGAGDKILYASVGITVAVIVALFCVRKFL